MDRSTHCMRAVAVANLALLACLLPGLSLQAGAASRPEGRTAEVDPERDPRLNTRVSVEAYDTTVGRVLEELGRKTGVRLRAGTAEVREQPVIVFLRPRPLHGVMRLLAEEFEWDQERDYGWFWLRRKGTEPPEYELHKDLATQRLPAEWRLRDRRAFAEDLERELQEYRKPNLPGITPEDVLAPLPPAAWRAALEGRKVVLPWAQCSPALRAIANLYLASFTTGDDLTWVEVSTEGEGAALSLKVMFNPYGRGGIGMNYQPRGYQRRFRAPAPTPNAAPKSYSGLAARPLSLTKEEAEQWSSLRTLPELLQRLAEKAGADFIADEYGYIVHWNERRPTLQIPFGEPLGAWLDQLEQKLWLPTKMGDCAIAWREVDGCLLLRNRNWYGEEALWPPLTLRTWLSGLQGKGAPYVLSLRDVNKLLDQADDATLWRLTNAGLLRRGSNLGARRGLFRLWHALDAGRVKKLLSPEGLRISQLTVAQRKLATGHGPGREPVITDWILENQQGGDLTMKVRKLENGRVEVRYVTPKHTRPPTVFDLRLPMPSDKPGVCRVKVEEAKEPFPERN